MNYRLWVQRAYDFVKAVERFPGIRRVRASLAPPLTLSEIASLETELRIPLTQSMKSFLGEGSAACDCRYYWEVPKILDELNRRAAGGNLYGGPNLCLASELRKMQEWAWGLGDVIASYRSEDAPAGYADVCKRSLPFAVMQNGDFLALDVQLDAKDPPVVYLAHDWDDDKWTVAPSFEVFCATWEEVCYVGPEIDKLVDYCGETNGAIETNTPKAEALRCLFTMAKQLSAR